MNGLDTTLAALADPTRRAILARLAKGEAITQDVSTLENPAILDQLKQTN